MSGEQKGCLRQWNEEKGFGFIKPELGGADVFVHASAVFGAKRLSQGQTLLYLCAPDERGRLKATHVRVAGELAIDNPDIRRAPRTVKATAKPRAPRVSGSSPKLRTKHQPSARSNAGIKVYGVALVFSLLPFLGCVQAYKAGHSWPAYGYLLMSLFAFMAYWKDKRSAQQGEWRTPENTLHVLELLGGWAGAWLARQWLRHKTNKASFLATSRFVVLIHNLFWFDYVLLKGRLFDALWRILS